MMERWVSNLDSRAGQPYSEIQNRHLNIRFHFTLSVLDGLCKQLGPRSVCHSDGEERDGSVVQWWIQDFWKGDSYV